MFTVKKNLPTLKLVDRLIDRKDGSRKKYGNLRLKKKFLFSQV